MTGELGLYATHFLIQRDETHYYRSCDSSCLWYGKIPQTVAVDSVNCGRCQQTKAYKNAVQKVKVNIRFLS